MKDDTTNPLLPDMDELCNPDTAEMSFNDEFQMQEDDLQRLEEIALWNKILDDEREDLQTDDFFR